MSKDDVKSFLTTNNTTPDPDYGHSIHADRDLMNKTYGVSSGKSSLRIIKNCSIVIIYKDFT